MLQRTLRLAIYVDGPYRVESANTGERLVPDPVDLPFLTFASAVGSLLGTTTVFARVVGGPPAEGARPLAEDVRWVALPGYSELGRLPDVVRVVGPTLRAMWAGLSDVDIVWAFGPHPFQLVLAVMGRLRSRRVVLGVRQDTATYFRMRATNRRWIVSAAVTALGTAHRLVARFLPVTVVGSALEREYGPNRGGLLTMTVGLVRDRDVALEAPSRAWNGEVRLLTVGRIDVEKNPLLVVDLLAELERRQPGRFRLEWLGTGPLRGAVSRRAAELGVAARLDLRGQVPFGPEVIEAYRRAHVFVHVSRTEGLPQVIIEALAVGTPTVATDVGSVAEAVDEGRAGVLVPPENRDALADAVELVTGDAELRARLIRRGLDLAAERTLERQVGQVARFLAHS
jgi:glycosyltransferase involved in cell wall biosynthesis